MKTLPLFYEDPEETAFTARILAREKTDNGVRLLLERTQFYPGGGGQPADGGTLEGIPVSLRKQDGEIWHHLSHFPEDRGNSPVSGRVDEARRNDYRQQHTGQHILSAAFAKTGNYPTVSVHLGEKTTTIDFETSSIPQDDIDVSEELANRIVTENRPIRFHWTDSEGLSNFQLRRPTKQQGAIRVVEIEGFDQAACGGLHFTTTGRVGLVKFMGLEKIRGNCRTHWSIGKRALGDYRRKLEVLKELSTLTSTPQDQLSQRIRDILREGGEKQKALRDAQGRIASLLAEDLTRRADKGVLTASLQEENAIFRALTQTLLLEKGLRFCLINVFPGEDPPIKWILGGGPETDIPFQDIRNRLFPLINAKGGGRPPLWQGGGGNLRGIEEFLDAFRELLRNPGSGG